ncbi:MAG TPA: acetate--CoA ligase family protein, partial [Solirubrobacterales bacterium]|nr:acetate--CoA ligase family protein [Solirubrobacterales bacterium]
IASVAGITTAIVCARELRREPASPKRLHQIASAARTGGESEGKWLGEAESKALLRGAGVPVPEGRVVQSADESVPAAMSAGWPVALKLSGPHLFHKSDIGAVVLNIGDEESLRAHAERLLALPDAEEAELLVEAMAPAGGVELILAARADAVVPALVIGLGGVWTEALGDVKVIPLPAPTSRIERALAELQGAPLLYGSRGTLPVDTLAIATIASRIGEFLIEEGLSLIEVNPLIAGPDGAIAADALIRR